MQVANKTVDELDRWTYLPLSDRTGKASFGGKTRCALFSLSIKKNGGTIEKSIKRTRGQQRNEKLNAKGSTDRIQHKREKNLEDI